MQAKAERAAAPFEVLWSQQWQQRDGRERERISRI